MDGLSVFSRKRTLRWALGFALAVAFSPLLVNWLQHVLQYPWARGAIIFPWLAWIVFEAGRGRRRAPPSLLFARLCLYFAIVVQLVSVAGADLRFARLAIVAAAIGSAWATGLLRWPESIFLAWLLPVPSAIIRLTDPLLVRGVAGTAASLGGADLVAVDGRVLLDLGGQTLPLTPADGGLALCVGLAGVGWFHALMQRAAFSGVIVTASLWGLSGLLIQTLVVASSSFVGTTEIAREGLDAASWVLVVVAGLGTSVGPWRLLERSDGVLR